MNEGIIQEIDAERGQIVDVQRLVEAVRRSRAAQVLYELRSWLPRSIQGREDGTASSSAIPPNPSLTSTE
jgi:hypothetical protein